jgi:hypothetical protein
LTDDQYRRRRVIRWIAAAVAVSAVGFLGWTMGSSSGPGRPAVAASAGVYRTETPEISDPTDGPVPASGAGRDALTPGELAQARDLALDADLRAETTDVTGAPGPEVLSVQLPETDGEQAPRRAALLLYDYRGDRLLKRVVNLTAGRVESTFAGSGRQPPPTTREVGVATDLLWHDGAAAILRDRFRQATGTTLTSPAQLSTVAQTFTANPADRGPAAGCGTHRCLMLLARPPERPFLDLTDLVVDLSAGTVVRLGK